MSSPAAVPSATYKVPFAATMVWTRSTVPPVHGRTGVCAAVAREKAMINVGPSHGPGGPLGPTISDA